ncbi:hypothetical protein QOZ80_8BG0654330 [Eleusine coracana subsp. coracana]|nr:hypothetical protein QOZ80_8BG0654330 [Eleusine coracana subsp. coracana]
MTATTRTTVMTWSTPSSLILPRPAWKSFTWTYEDHNMMFSNAGSMVRLAFLLCAATLRTLELSNCGVKACGGALGFSRLSSLVLRNCLLPEGYLQDVVDAAPALSSLRLQDLRHEPQAEKEEEEKKRYSWNRKCYLLRFRLRCLTLTELVLVACGTVRKEEVALSYSGIELDVPNLQSFSYRGHPVRLALTLPMPNLARVNIDDTGRSGYDRDRYRSSYSYGDDEDKGPKKLVPLSSMIESFRDTRALRLRVDCIEDILDIVEDDQQEGHNDAVVILPVFHNLHVLELEGHYRYMNKHTEATMACLPESCPVLSELRLKLKMMWDYRYRFAFEDPEENRDIGLDQFRFMSSIDRFKRFKSSLVVPFQRGIDGCCVISDLPALSNRTFSCLRTSLRKVELKFEAKEINCFQVQLAKFLVENTVPLEEMHINDGEKIFWDHLSHKVTKWRADAFRRNKLPNNESLFAVYHLVNKCPETNKLRTQEQDIEE